MINSAERRVLIADDDSADRNYLAGKLGPLGLDVQVACDGGEALQLVQTFQPHVIVSDIRMPRVDGFELIRKLREFGHTMPVILLTQFGTIDQAISAVHQAGAFWFLEKPVAPEPLYALILRACEQASLSEENNRLRNVLRAQKSGQLIGAHPSMHKLFDLVAQVGPKKTNVLLTGESGTGKEVFARAIHDIGPRKDSPFIAVNCAAMPEGLLESELFGHEKGAFTGASERQLGKIELAHGGTLFLDEIGELAINMQPKLLRVLEDSKVRRLGGRVETQVDVRFIAATNRDPQKAIAQGQFREDLFYRLAVFQLELPPLRERIEDIPALSCALLGSLDRKYERTSVQLSKEVEQALCQYHWPGNVRELRNVLERAHILSGDSPIGLRHLPSNLFTAIAPIAAPVALVDKAVADASEIRVALGASMEEVERALILGTYDFTGKNRKQTAEILGLSLKTIQNKLRQYRMIEGEDSSSQAMAASESN